MKRHTYLVLASLVLSGGLLIGAGAALAQQGELSVTEIVLGSTIEAGVPTEPSTTFSRSDRAIYCMVRLSNPSGEAGAIRIAFERADGEPVNRQAGHRLEFPARRRYRTLARAGTSRAAGAYRCVVRTDEGVVLQHADFTMTE